MTCGSVFSETLADMTFRQVEAAIERGAAVLVPVGVIEEHGPHLPLATDVYGAYRLCRLVRAELAPRGAEALIAPPVYWGINHVTSAFVGSFRVRPETAASLLRDVLDTLVEDGFAHVLVVNHHGDMEHNRMLCEVLRAQHERGHGHVRWLESRAMVARLGADAGEAIWVAYDEPPEAGELGFMPQLGVHAHDAETALVMRYHPDLVDHDALRELRPTELTEEDLARWRRGGEDAAAVTPDGYFGAPAPADPMLWRIYELRAAAMARAAAGVVGRPAP